MEFTLLWMKLQILKEGQGILQTITQHIKNHLKQTFSWMIQHVHNFFRIIDRQGEARMCGGRGRTKERKGNGRNCSLQQSALRVHYWARQTLVPVTPLSFTDYG